MKGKIKQKKYMKTWITYLFMLMFVITISTCSLIERYQEGNTVQAAVRAKELNPSLDMMLKQVGDYILNKDTNPDYSSIWNIIGVIRSERSLSSTYAETFYKNVIAYMNENNWDLNTRKYSDYSKLILAVTAIGKDARNVEGHNLFTYLSDFSNVKTQGFNGAIWALIALDSHGQDYAIPVNPSVKDQNSREKMIDSLLRSGYMKTNGGWSLYNDASAEADVDITAMTIQALAPYYSSRTDVKNAVDKGLDWLSYVQLEKGGYATMGIETSESNAQVIVALCSLGIHPANDERFILNNGNWTMSRLFEYYKAENSSMGGFMHVQEGAQNNGGGEAGKINGMATEQGMYATVAYKRFLEGKTSLYDMSDIKFSSGESNGGKPNSESTNPSSNQTTQSPTKTTEKQGSNTEAKITVKVNKVSLNYKQITLGVGKKRSLSASVLPSNASNKSLTWKSSNKKIATVTSKGLVKGIKAGTAKITVTAKDGSNKKASCTVIVTTSSSANTSKKTAGGQTKTLNTNKRATGSGTASNIANGQTKQVGKSQTNTGTSKEENPAEATTQNPWSFSGEEYVPENYDTEPLQTEQKQEGSTDEVMETGSEDVKSTSWADKTITITLPIGPITYILSGMILLAVIEGIIWWIRKRRKKL